MRTQRSRIGRRRKVFKQEKAHISFTGKAVTSSAGMALVSRALDAFSIRDQLKTIFPSLDKDQKYPTSTFFEQLVALKILGGDAISDAALLDDAVMKAMFDRDCVAHPTTFGRRLKALTWRHNLALESILTRLSQRVTKPGTQVVAIDSTVATVFGQQIEGAERGYNPHKPGRNSYHPLLAVDVGSRSVVDGYLRSGSCASNDGLDGFIHCTVSRHHHNRQIRIAFFDILKQFNAVHLRHLHIGENEVQIR